MASDILQFVVYGLLLGLLAWPLGIYMAQLFTDQRTVLAPILGPLERGFYRAAGIDPENCRPALDALCAVLPRFQPRRLPAALRDAAAPIFPAVEPAGPAGAVAAPCLQHRGQLRHQHQLAVLWRRDDDVLFQPDGRADDAELRVGGDRHRRRGRGDPRLRRARKPRRRQFLGRSDALDPLRPAAAVDRRRPVPRLAGRAAEPAVVRSVPQPSKAPTR